jgi:hypothetical protein
MTSKQKKRALIHNKKKLKKNKNKETIIKNMGMNFPNYFYLMENSLDKFVNTFKKTNIFEIKIDKKLIMDENDNDKMINDDSSDEYEDEADKKEKSKNMNIKEEKEKDIVPGYTFLIEDLTKIKGKRFDSIIISLFLIEMYEHIKNNEKINELFLDVQKSASFLNNDDEICYFIYLALDKVISFINKDKNILKKDTINEIKIFINERINKYIINEKTNKYKESLINNIKDKNNKFNTLFDEETKKE